MHVSAIIVDLSKRTCPLSALFNIRKQLGERFIKSILLARCDSVLAVLNGINNTHNGTQLCLVP